MDIHIVLSLLELINGLLQALGLELFRAKREEDEASEARVASVARDVSVDIEVLRGSDICRLLLGAIGRGSRRQDGLRVDLHVRGALPGYPRQH